MNLNVQMQSLTSSTTKMNRVIGKVARVMHLSRLSFKDRGSKPHNYDLKALVLENKRQEGSIMINAIPKGNLAVYVGSDMKRFVIPMSYLRVPEMRVVMDQMAEEFGHHQKEGGLRIPICDEQEFEDILASCKRRQQLISKTKKGRLTRHNSFINF